MPASDAKIMIALCSVVCPTDKRPEVMSGLVHIFPRMGEKGGEGEEKKREKKKKGKEERANMA